MKKTGNFTHILAMAAAAAVLTASSALACSDVVVPAGKSGELSVSGRTLDYDTDYPSSLVYVPRGLPWDSTRPNQTNGVHWIGQYGFIGISLPGEERRFLDGMNEAGMSASLLWQAGAAFGSGGAPDVTLCDADLVAWVLGGYAEVPKALGALQVMQVWHSAALLPHTAHLVLHDEHGRSAVVEWKNGEMQIFTGKDYKGVTTNEPDYDEQKRNLKLYDGRFTNQDPWDKKLNDWLEGGGMLGMMGDDMSKSRFVRLYTLATYALQSFEDTPIYIGRMYGPDWSVQSVFHLLGRVGIPRGTMTHIDPELGRVYPYTLWALVRDHSRRRLYFRGYQNTTERMINLQKIAFDKNEIKVIGPVEPRYGGEGSAEDVTFRPCARLGVDPQQLQLSLTAVVSVRPEDQGRPGDMYIFAKRRSGKISYWKGGRWRRAKAAGIEPCWRSDALRTKRFYVLRHRPASIWRQTSIYAGYGDNPADMFVSDQYHRVAAF